MKIDLSGKTALVCGASKGIGRQTAIQFACSGASVIALARSGNALNELLKEMSVSSGQKHIALPLDLENYTEAASKIQEIIHSGIGIDILINNAGGPKPGRLLDADIESFVSAFNRHLFASQLITKAVVPGMINRMWGRIINITSIGAKQPVDDLGVSNTLRGAMSAWAKTLSRELGNYGITVNNILPGQTLTERLQDLIEGIAKKTHQNTDQVKQEMISNIPAGRLGTPCETAYAITFLASNEASFINGINLPVDGGFLRTL